MDVKQLENELLQLDQKDRARLAHRLILSLDEQTPKEIEEAWLDVAERRLREIKSGEVRPVPAEDVRKRVKAILR